MVEVRTPDNDSDWQAYSALMQQAFGKPASDLRIERQHAVTRLAVCRGKVCGGAMAFPVPQIFNGAEIPSALLASVCVAPEMRGAGVVKAVIESLVEDLRDRGVVLISLWTPSVGIYSRWGWQVANVGQRWAIPSSDLRSFSIGNAMFEEGLGESCGELQYSCVRSWNGPIRRPDWWWDWKVTSDLSSYRMIGSSGAVEGLVTLKTASSGGWGFDVFVSEFWAQNREAVRKLYAFLGQFSSQGRLIRFQQGLLPTFPSISSDMKQFSCEAEAWYPWMVRVINVPALFARLTWPGDVDLTVEVIAQNEVESYHLRVCDGEASATMGRGPRVITLSIEELTRSFLAGSLTAHLSAASRDEPSEALAAVFFENRLWLPDVF